MNITDKARLLRKNQTDVERVLWQQLLNKQFENAKFKRQYPIEPFIVDFVCIELKLVIELDGGQHKDQLLYDKHRQLFLEQRGYKVLRFWNNEVVGNLSGVLEVIRMSLLERRGRGR